MPIGAMETATSSPGNSFCSFAMSGALMSFESSTNSTVMEALAFAAPLSSSSRAAVRIFS